MSSPTTETVSFCSQHQERVTHCPQCNIPLASNGESLRSSEREETLRSIVDFAYQQGFHEVGCDIVSEFRAEQYCRGRDDQMRAAVDARNPTGFPERSAPETDEGYPGIAHDFETARLHLAKIKDERLTWGMICNCNCQSCVDLDCVIRDVPREKAPETSEQPVAYLVRTRSPGEWREFATLPGYHIRADETLLSETPLYARSDDKQECSTCNDTGEIDETLGGIARSNPHAPCPDCRPVKTSVLSPEEASPLQCPCGAVKQLPSSDVGGWSFTPANGWRCSKCSSRNGPGGQS